MSSGPSRDVYTEILAVFDQREDPCEPLTTPEIADSLSAVRRTIYKRLEALVERGDVKTKKAGARARVWWRSADAISGRERLERGLQVEQEPFRIALESSPLVAFRLDTDLRYTWIANPHEDFERDAVIGKRDDELLPPDAAETIMEPKRKALETGERVHEKVTYELPSGQVSYDITVAPLRDETGKIIGLIATSLDITEQQQREWQLEQYRRQYRTLIENFPSGAVALVDQDMRYVAFGGTPEGETDVTRADLEGKPVREVLPPQIADVVIPRYEAALDGETSAFEDTIDERVYQFHFLPVRDDQGEIFAVTAMSQDITDRKHTEEKLRESKAWLSKILEQLPAAVGVFDTDGNFRLQNDRMQELAMGDRIPSRNSETRGNWTAVDDDGERLPPEQWPGARASHGEAVSPGIEFRFEENDETRWMDVAAMPISQSRQGTEVSVVIQDITERKRREQQLEQYKTIIETAEDAVYFVDNQHRFVLVNDAYCDLVGRSREALLGEHITVVASEETAEAARELRAEAADSGIESDRFEMDFTASDGTIRNTEVNYSYLRDMAGIIKGVAGVIRDITERKQREEELAALNHLNSVFQDITHAIIESSSRTEIEQTITEHLTSFDSYEYAWIGHVDRHGENIVPQSAGTNEAELSEIPLSSANDDPTAHSQAAEAIRTGEMQVTYDSIADPVLDQWKPSQDSHRAGISIPITYGDRVYGVLNVYTARENAFDESECRIVERISEVVGHAINSIEQKRALLEDRVTEVTFRSDKLENAWIDAVGDDSFTMSIDESIFLSEGQTISYYTFDGIEPEAVFDAVENLYPGSECHLITETGSKLQVEVKTTHSTGTSQLAKYNSRMVDGTFENGEFRFTVGVPQSTDVREIIGLMEEVFPDIEVVSQTDVERANPHLSDVFSDLDNQLTERQRTALEVAYYSGYFDWPRGVTGEELAERLDITPATVHHHLRHGEHKLMAAFFDAVKVSEVGL